MEFKPFKKIEHIGKLFMTITQKIHGTNAQICIYEYTSTNGQSHEPRIGIKAGSRTRWIVPEDDNYGFAAWVEKNKDALIEFFGSGTFFGEWAGPGINSGEGLTEKTFILFDYKPHWFAEGYKSGVPPQVKPVPILYQGKLDIDKIDAVMEDLKLNGSRLVPGFMRPEGVVISAAGERFKKVFNAEETGWKREEKKEVREKPEGVDYNYLCQPIRLEKLLSRDESYTRNYPVTLSKIVKDYVADLIEEGQISGEPEKIKGITKSASGQIFTFVKTIMGERI